MKQIGARQEAGRIGGIGPCGRPLCCSSWMTHFVSVGTGAARVQDLSMNPQKLAGQCAKLKCCLNFEIDSYSEAQKKLPPKDITLETKDGTYYYFKPDILARKITYSTDKSIPANLVTIDASRAFEIIALNRQGIKVDSLDEADDKSKEKPVYVDLVEQESLTRFDNSKRRKRRRAPQDADRQQKGNAHKGGNAPKQADKNDNRPKNAEKTGDRNRQPRNKGNRNNKKGRPDQAGAQTQAENKG